MKNFIKKYWTHIFNISVFAYLIFIFMLFTNIAKTGSSVQENQFTFFIVLLLVEFIMVLGVWAEIIYFIIKAVKDKELRNKWLHIIGIYFLNMFYIPCFSLKYIHKDSKAKFKNSVYVLVTVCMFIAFCLSVIRFQGLL